MGNNSVPKFIFRLSRFPVHRGSVLGRFYCIILIKTAHLVGEINGVLWYKMHGTENFKIILIAFKYSVRTSPRTLYVSITKTNLLL